MQLIVSVPDHCPFMFAASGSSKSLRPNKSFLSLQHSYLCSRDANRQFLGSYDKNKQLTIKICDFILKTSFLCLFIITLSFSYLFFFYPEHFCL